MWVLWLQGVEFVDAPLIDERTASSALCGTWTRGRAVPAFFRIPPCTTIVLLSLID